MAKSWKSCQRWLLVVAVLFVCIAIVTFIMALIFDSLFTKLMLKQITILPDSLVYKSWQKPSVPVFFSFYVFNLTNLDAVMSGAKPVFQEIGPFVYREARDRVDIVFSNETPPQTVSFKQRVLHHFIPEHSIAHPADVTITTVNLVHFGARSSSWSSFAGFLPPFSTMTVNDLAWGTVPWFSQFCSTCPEKIGLFFEKNGTSAESLTIKTGVTDIKSIGQIVSVGGKRKMDVWDHAEANVIKGTDGSVAAPGMSIGSKFHIFVPSLCRSVTTYAVGMANALNREEIELLAFSGIPSPSEAAAARRMNSLFCKSGKCPYEGLIDVETCLKERGSGLPLFFSSPHFMNVHPNVTSMTAGKFKPDELKHSTWMRIEPNTGFVLEAFQRMQLNMFVDSNAAGSNNPFYFPMAWISEEAAADRDSLNTLYDKLLYPKKVIPIILAVLCVVATVLSVTSLVFLTFGKRLFTGKTRKANDSARADGPTDCYGNMADGDLKSSHPIDDHLRAYSTGPPHSSKLHSQVPEAKPLLNPTENGDTLST